MIRFSTLLCIAISSPAVTAAQGTSEPSSLVIEFEVSTPDENGKIVIEPKSQYDRSLGVVEGDGVERDQATTQKVADAFEKYNEYGVMDAVEGFAFLDKNGEVLDVYAAPLGPEGYQYLVEKIPDGGAMKPVAFWGNAKSLPTMEEVRQITETSVQKALDVICAAEPRPESLAIEIALAASLGLEGKFQLNMEWRPARDCN